MRKSYTKFSVTLPVLLTLGTCSVGVCFLNVRSRESKSLTSESLHSTSYYFFLLFVTGKWSRPEEPAAPGRCRSLPERRLRRVPAGAAQGRRPVVCGQQPATRFRAVLVNKPCGVVFSGVFGFSLSCPLF